MKSICFISNRYPNELAPIRQVFVQKLVWAMADLGVDCTVISPVPVNQYFPDYKRLPIESFERSPGGSKIKLYFPRYFSLGQKEVGLFNTARVTTNLFTNCVKKIFKGLSHKPEVVYGHFFTPAGICASRIGRTFNIPSFAAYGESTPWSIFNYGKEKIKTELATLAGVISVSSANRATLLDIGLVNEEKVEVFPNGFQPEEFNPKDKVIARDKFGFNQQDFIVSYVGQFSERKGVLRLADAADGLENVTVAFAGKGELKPKNRNCIFNATVKPEDMPFFLSASDVFVLPTLHEGCSNAIVEAMACGLPIVSSNLPFNKDILNDKNSIQVNPLDVDAIRQAILLLRDDSKKLKSLKEGALEKSHELTINIRASDIKSWMDSIVDK